MIRLLDSCHTCTHYIPSPASSGDPWGSCGITTAAPGWDNEYQQTQCAQDGHGDLYRRARCITCTTRIENDDFVRFTDGSVQCTTCYDAAVNRSMERGGS